jgi:hypothetical protein
VNTSLFNVLHDRADHYVSPIADSINVHFDGAVEEVVQQHRAVVRHFHRVTQVALEFVFFVDDFHRPTAQYVGRTHHQRVADLCWLRESLRLRCARWR